MVLQSSERTVRHSAAVLDWRSDGLFAGSDSFVAYDAADPVTAVAAYRHRTLLQSSKRTARHSAANVEAALRFRIDPERVRYRADIVRSHRDGQEPKSAREKGILMSTGAWIIIVIVIIVILAVLAFVFMNRRATARRARAEKIRQEATERAAELDRKEAEANAMAAQAQDARAEAERLESVSAEQRKDTVEARTGVEDALRKADRIDPDVRDRRTDAPSARRASDDPGARRASDDPSASRATDDDTSARRATNEVSDDEAVEDRTVRGDEAKSSRADVSDNSVTDDVRRNDDGGEPGVVDDRSTDPRR